MTTRVVAHSFQEERMKTRVFTHSSQKECMKMRVVSHSFQKECITMRVFANHVAAQSMKMRVLAHPAAAHPMKTGMLPHLPTAKCATMAHFYDSPFPPALVVPTGPKIPAQGWSAATTLGKRSKNIATPRGLHRLPMEDSTPLGLEFMGALDPG